MLLDKAGLEKVVPHKGPMFILDRLMAEDLAAGSVRVEIDIHPDARFYRPEMAGVPVWVGFEYMAQAIAALSGRMGEQKGLAEPRIGFIMGVRDFTCASGAFPDGSVVSVEAAQVFRDGPVVSFGCRICCGAEELVSAQVNAIEVDDTNMNMLMGEGCNG